jgi:putative membrane protein
MYVKRNYGLFMTFNWSKGPFFIGLLYAFVIHFTIDYFKLDFSIPWQPISIIGIAVAFYLGFKNNSSYDRTWEARKIWGGMVNSSRTFGAAVVAFVQGENADAVKKELIYRHIAWLTALRHQLRLSREWEHTKERLNGKYAPTVCEDYTTKLRDELAMYVSETDLKQLDDKSNTATQLLRIQSTRLQELRDKAYFEDFRHIEFHALIARCYNDQGAAERIKNFPFPRQYASTALWLTVVFGAFIPFGLVDVFRSYSSWIFWLSPLFSALVTWVFFLMEKIGDYSENPFEGTYNDVPITSIAKGIEIDLREMINDSNVPAPVKAENGFLM